MTQVTLNGNIYADDGTNRDLPTGWRTWFMPLLSDLLAHLAAYLSTLGNALAATSTTGGVAIGSGAKTLTVQAGKGFAAGMWIVAANTASPTNAMVGQVTSYDSTTGALAFTVAASDVSGAGTPTNWTIGLSGKTGPSGTDPNALPKAGGTMSGAINYAGNVAQSATLYDTRYTRVDKGNSASGTVTFDVSAANWQKVTVTGSPTFAISSWPSSVGASLFLEIVNGGSGTITWPTISFVKSDGTTQSGPSRSLQSSGTDYVMLWRNGTTVFGKVI